MKKVSIYVAIFLVIAACQKKDTEHKLNEQTNQNKTGFDESMKDLRVKDLKVTSSIDTISYALGLVWGNQLASKVGLSKVSFTFYQGAFDYMNNNKTFTTIQEASDRLDKEIDFLKQDAVHTLDINQKISDISLTTKYDTLSYQLGYAWMRGAKDIGISAISPALLLGLTSGLNSDTTLFDFRRADRYLRSYIDREREEKFLPLKVKNEDWLKQNKSKKGVVTLPSGLQYKIIKNGKGKSPRVDEIVVCHYTGKLIDNTKFESTYDEGVPLKAFPSGVIPGWREALPLMKVGSVWELYIPYNLGYGSGGVKDKVPPFATLIYELELLEVTKIQ